MHQAANPIDGANRFKLDFFNANCDGGFAVSTAPERRRRLTAPGRP
jgi:hypothetical protein